MKVLIVDDSMFFRTLIRQTVTASGHGALEIKEAMDAEEALLLCARFKPDLLIVDLNLPGMSGLDLIDSLRQESPRAKFGIITSSKDPGVNERAVAAGAAFFISKPFTKSGVQEALRQVLN
jgi:two-component system chemotaxis response regulator CheY